MMSQHEKQDDINILLDAEMMDAVIGGSCANSCKKGCVQQCKHACASSSKENITISPSDSLVNKINSDIKKPTSGGGNTK